MRTAGRVAAFLVMLVAVLTALLGAAIAIDNDGDSDLILGGILLAVPAALVAGVAFLAQRALAKPAGPRPRADLAAAERGETVQLRPSRVRWALVLLTSLLFAGALVPLAIIEPSVHSVVGALLFGSGVVAAAYALVPGAMYLRIDRTGILVKRLLRAERYPWEDIERFRVFEVSTRYSTQRLVGFDLRALTEGERTLWQRLGRGMSGGVDVGLPGTYGENADDLAAALQRIRDRRLRAWGQERDHLGGR